MNRNFLLIATIMGILLFAMPSKIYNSTRLLSLNNPGGVRRTGDQWQGMSATQPDPDFVSFVAPEYGIRAIARILLNYSKRGLNTVEEIISTWAPPTENLTAAYIDHVADQLNVEADQALNVRAVLPHLIPAIIRHENGSQPYPDTLIARGIALAG